MDRMGSIEFMMWAFLIATCVAVAGWVTERDRNKSKSSDHTDGSDAPFTGARLPLAHPYASRPSDDEMIRRIVIKWRIAMALLVVIVSAALLIRFVT